MLIVPAHLRRVRWLVVCGLCCWGAWQWLGASGLALLGLYCLHERPWQRRAFSLPLKAARLDAVRVEPWRLLLEVDGEPVEVYRDELTAEDWCALRREVNLRREEGVERSWLSWPRAAARRAGRRSRER